MSKALQQSKTPMEKNENTFVGIDVAKDELVVHILPTSQQLTVPNDTNGIKELIKLFKKEVPKQVLLEATGKLERELVTQIVANGMTVVVINPRQARDLAKGLGELAKTDAVDAKILARIAQLQCIAVKPLPTKEIQDMSDLVARRKQLVDMRVQEKNRLQQTKQKTIIKSITKTIDTFDKQIAAVEAEIKKMLDRNSDWNEKDKILQSMPGVGQKTSQTLISALPELGELNRQEIASLAGLAPHCKDSGKKSGVRQICGGRSEVRSALYMAAVSAIKHNKPIKEFYERLTAKGKKFKVAIVAVMRKMITVLNSMIKTKTTWKEKIVQIGKKKIC